MGLITRCPACGTMFKVVADQLRISEGWVRCGHCTEIFDAAADLRDESELDLPEPAVHEDAPAVHEPAPPAAHHEHGEPIESIERIEPIERDPVSEYPSVHSEVGDEVLQGTPDAIEIEEQVQVLHEHPLDEPFTLRRQDDSDLAHAGPHGFSRPAPLEPEPELHDLSFVRQARRQEFWRKPGLRFLLVLVALLLAALLLAQVAWHDRDRVAAAYPGLRPVLARTCDVLNCRLAPPRQIDAVGIETSSFNKLRGDTYRVSVTLKNLAGNAVAMPALELTLTDVTDQPVVRRVVQPAEFAQGATSLAARADWSTTIGIAVNPNAAPTRIAGYRLLAFYP